MDKDFGPAENVKVLSPTLVRLYLARPPFGRVVLLAIRLAGFGGILLNIRYPSRN
jgi:hypothetical protein